MFSNTANLAVRDATSDFKDYNYSPSMVAAIIFIVLFIVVTAGHLFRMFRHRTWFMVPFCLGGLFEIAGYVGRSLSASENPGPYQQGPYILQSITLLVAPALFAASIYMELARISLMANAEDRLIIRRTRLTKVFVGGDIASFLLQALGAGQLASSNSKSVNLGKWIVVGGLVVQIVFFGLFTICSALFHKRLNRAPTNAALTTPWKKHMMGLYIVSILIFLRSIVRVVEFVQGYSGYVISHEAFLYIFDALPMCTAMATMLIIHPFEVAETIRNKQQIKEAGPDALGRNYVSV